MAVTTGMIAVAISVGIGTLLVHLERRDAAAQRAVAEQSVFERFTSHYRRIDQGIRDRLYLINQTIDNNLAQLFQDSQGGQAIVAQGQRHPAWQSLICQQDSIAFSQIVRPDGSQSTSFFTGKSALQARLEQHDGKKSLLISGMSLSLQPFPKDVICYSGLANVPDLNQLELAALMESPSHDANWSTIQNIPWRQLSKLLIEGPPGLVVIRDGGAQAALLPRDTVMVADSVPMKLAPGSLEVLLSPDQRSLIAASRRQVAEGGAVALGEDLEAELANLSVSLGYPIYVSFNGISFSDGLLGIDDQTRDAIAKKLSWPQESVEVFGTISSGEREFYFAQVMPLPQQNLRIFALEEPKAPGMRLLEWMDGIDHRQREWDRRFMIVGILTCLLFVIWGLLLAYCVSQPLRRIAAFLQGLKQHKQGLDALPASRVIEIAQLHQACAELQQSLRQEAKLDRLLNVFVAPAVAEQLQRGVVHPGGARFFCAVLFADMRDFTERARHMRADEVIVLLNSCFDVLAPIIEKHGGLLDKYIGDAVMGIFGAPHLMDDPVRAAVEAATEMRQAIGDYNQARIARGLWPVYFGWGIAAGEVTAGVIGSNERASYSAVGDAVNLASRLCDIASPNEIVIPAELIEERHPIESTLVVHERVKGFGTLRTLRL